MADLLAELADAEARVALLRAKVAAGPCREYGHDWRHIGGCNAGCEHRGRDCGCSVPVHECRKCGDCDYGDNPEAYETIGRCAEQNP